MDIYFIRHGETEGNRKHRHQFNNSSLNDRGRQQANVVADLVLAFGPTELVTSPLARAAETAAAIARTTTLAPLERSEFMEVVRPAHIRGLHYLHPQSILFLCRWFFSGRSHYNDEQRGESYQSLIGRVEASKRFLESLPPDSRVIVVSHSIFINFFVQHICSNRPISFFSAFLRFAKIITLDNSSVTHVRYHPGSAPNTCAWEVVCFDNDAHVIR